MARRGLRDPSSAIQSHPPRNTIHPDDRSRMRIRTAVVSLALALVATPAAAKIVPGTIDDSHTVGGNISRPASVKGFWWMEFDVLHHTYRLRNAKGVVSSGSWSQSGGRLTLRNTRAGSPCVGGSAVGVYRWQYESKPPYFLKPVALSDRCATRRSVLTSGVLRALGAAG